MAKSRFRDEAGVALKLFEGFVKTVDGKDSMNQLSNIFGEEYNTQLNRMNKKELLKLAEKIKKRLEPGLSDEKMAWLFLLGYVVYRAERA